MLQFKIDTKETFVHIVVTDSQLDEKLADALLEQIKATANNGSNNYLIDLSGCPVATQNGLEQLAKIHEEIYEGQHSFVVTGLSPAIINLAKSTELDQVLNICPTEIEAIDIISMEILERDLFGEEES
ncbi:MAG: hypothetical protein JST36_08580 [Bacteroidetes bacterium]|nr:hypothetical protein [Bacteroidota bacterium]